MTYDLNRTTIPKTLAFPIKRSSLDAALEAAGVRSLATVTFTTRQTGNVVMRVEYTGEHRRGWVGAGKAAVFIYAVPTAERPSIEQTILRGPLGQLCAWLRKAEGAGDVWREADHHLDVSLSGGRSRFASGSAVLVQPNKRLGLAAPGEPRPAAR
jgi:hypothetical protein